MSNNQTDSARQFERVLREIQALIESRQPPMRRPRLPCDHQWQYQGNAAHECAKCGVTCGSVE